jgi:hypothetical protein
MRDELHQATEPTVLATLGRPLAAAANVTVPLFGPYEAYGDRIDQVDCDRPVRAGRPPTMAV